VLLAGASLVIYGQESNPQAPKQEAGSPPAAMPAKPVTPPAGVETDPAKLAAPAESGKVQTPPSGQRDFIIGAEDVLQIQIWGDPRLAVGSFRVRPDGKISIALLGELKASGKTAEQFGQEISDKLKSMDILRETRVNVNVTEINSRKIQILGEVNKPGSYPLIVPTNVLEALGNAGGFHDFANTKNITVQRGTERFKFNYKEVIAGKKLEQNRMLEPGDLIIVK
jgi:polysaccharide export outer membrane protein